MLLKWMSNEVRIKEHVVKNSSGKGFLNKVSYIGIYHRFDGPSLGSFTSRNTTDLAWETIFKHYFELVIGQRLVIFYLICCHMNASKFLEKRRQI